MAEEAVPDYLWRSLMRVLISLRMEVMISSSSKYESFIESKPKSMDISGAIKGGTFGLIHPTTGNELIGAYVKWSPCFNGGRKKADIKMNTVPTTSTGQGASSGSTSGSGAVSAQKPKSWLSGWRCWRRDANYLSRVVVQNLRTLCPKTGLLHPRSLLRKRQSQSGGKQMEKKLIARLIGLQL